MKTFNDLEVHSSKTAVISEDGERLSFLELVDEADLFLRGVHKRSLAILLCSNTVASIVTYIGLVRQGHVPILLPGDVSNKMLTAVLEAYKPQLVAFPTSASIESFQDFEVFGSNRGYSISRTGFATARMHDQLALLVPTSGTTGSPKMVRQSSTNLDTNAAAISQSLGLTSDDCAITTLPMSYVYGLSIINSQFLVGGSVVVTARSITDRVFWNQLREHKATYFGGVPYTYEVLNRLGLSQLVGTKIRMMTQAGGRLSSKIAASIHSQAKSQGIDFHIMYGQTEATARMSLLHADEFEHRPTSIGKAIPGGAIAIVNPETHDNVRTNEVGEIEYRGPNVALGYADNQKDLDKGDEFSGRLLTGDLGYLDGQGFAFITGRKKRFAKILGLRINLDDVEEKLATNGVTAVCTESRGILDIWVSEELEIPKAAQEVTNWLGLPKSLISVRRIDKFPRSSSGKVVYEALTERSDAPRN
jgi:acyl-CoA synthetase (AMP-forming)/AMP-acid ligase II